MFLAAIMVGWMEKSGRNLRWTRRMLSHATLVSQVKCENGTDRLLQDVYASVVEWEDGQWIYSL